MRRHTLACVHQAIVAVMEASHIRAFRTLNRREPGCTVCGPRPRPITSLPGCGPQPSQLLRPRVGRAQLLRSPRDRPGAQLLRLGWCASRGKPVLGACQGGHEKSGCWMECLRRVQVRPFVLTQRTPCRAEEGRVEACQRLGQERKK